MRFAKGDSRHRHIKYPSGIVKNPLDSKAGHGFTGLSIFVKSGYPRQHMARREEKQIGETMRRCLTAALNALGTVSDRQLEIAGRRVGEIVTLKHRIESIALQKGYSRACRDAIPVCRGWCCKTHYHRQLSPLDFFLAAYQMSGEQQATLVRQIAAGGSSGCPLLLASGCMLTFEQRPVCCTAAYPCFMDRAYWLEKETIKKQIKPLFESLLIDTGLPNRAA